MSAPTSLAERIEALAATPAGAPLASDAEAIVGELLDQLEAGAIRSAERDASGAWHAVPWVKRGILVGFRAGRIVDLSPRRENASSPFSFFDKHTMPTRHFAAADQVRIVPGGSTARRGAYVAPGVVCMPPMFINVGAYVGAGTMVDSHALVGSCAQVGARVHLSAAAQIGGVLEPVNASPVVIEDDVIVGGNCGVYEGTVVKKRAVLGTGTILNRSTPVYDLVRGLVYAATDDEPLVIPEEAVVVAGSRPIARGVGKDWGISLYTPVIVKYRDAKTDARIQLEDLLR